LSSILEGDAWLFYLKTRIKAPGSISKDKAMYLILEIMGKFEKFQEEKGNSPDIIILWLG